MKQTCSIHFFIDFLQLFNGFVGLMLDMIETTKRMTKNDRKMTEQCQNQMFVANIIFL